MSSSTTSGSGNAGMDSISHKDQGNEEESFHGVFINLFPAQPVFITMVPAASHQDQVTALEVFTKDWVRATMTQFLTEKHFWKRLAIDAARAQMDADMAGS